MDFVETPYGGEDLEVPLLTMAVFEPTSSDWSKYIRGKPYALIEALEDNVAVAVQGWLYFQLLAVLSGKTISGREFSIARNNTGSVVNSSRIKSMIIDFQLRVLLLPARERTEVLDYHKKTLVAAQRVSRWVECQFAQEPDHKVDLIFLSVKILLGTVYQGYYGTLIGGNRLVQPIHLPDAMQRREDRLRAADRVLVSEMRRNGWCVHQIHKILSRFSYHTAYYFARMPRPRSAELDHRTCTKSSCRAWNSIPGHTGPVHATDGCRCSTISVSRVDVAKIIQKGHIPLVSIEEDGHGEVTLRVHTKKWYSKYVAVSHVWADGLGNAFENGLPACQLRMLQTYLAEIAKTQLRWRTSGTSGKSMPLWMDTLCIPVQANSSEVQFDSDVLARIKAKAIDSMNVVYSSSTHTLVLDAEMRKLPTSVTDACKLAYSQCCGWSTRSWTLQECYLAPKTVFALEDGIYSPHMSLLRDCIFMGSKLAFQLDLQIMRRWNFSTTFTIPYRKLSIESVRRRLDLLVDHEILWSCHSFSIWDTYTWRKDKPNLKALVSRNRYAEVWNELINRVSSLPADTPAILANLLGVSAYGVLQQMTEHERIAVIIRQQKVLPIQILFNTGPRLQKPLRESGSQDLGHLQPQQQVEPLEPAAEEWIALVERVEPLTQLFKNGWIPSTIGGDRLSCSLLQLDYLKVLDECLQIHSMEKEQPPLMFTIAKTHIPAAAFVLDSSCHTIDQIVPGRTDSIFISITRVGPCDYSETSEDERENVIGHCFMYDGAMFRAMLQEQIDDASTGQVYDTPGCHLVILDRSDRRITTRYVGPIRLSIVTEKEQRIKALPTLKCQCNCCAPEEDRILVDILYDADDLGPILKPSPDTPNQLMLSHTQNPGYVFFIHYIFLSTSGPYVDPIRPRLATATWFIFPLVVYLYQRFIVKRAAKRIFLEPLNDRRHNNQSYACCSRGLRRHLDMFLIAHWSIFSFGPALECVFWLTLKGSQGSPFTSDSDYFLFAMLTALVHSHFAFLAQLWYPRVLWLANLAFVFVSINFLFIPTWEIVALGPSITRVLWLLHFVFGLLFYWQSSYMFQRLTCSLTR